MLTETQRLASLWHMITLDPRRFLAPMSYIGGAVSEWKMLQQLEGHVVPQALSMDMKVGFLRSVELLKEAATALAMPTTLALVDAEFKDLVEHLAPDRPYSARELQRLILFGDKVVSVFIAEAEARSFVALAHGHAGYLSPEVPLFGDAVDDAFPASGQEIADAGKCRAAGLWTASVMHLMRAVEEPLNSLAQSLGVDAGQNWNTALNQIDAALRARNKSQHGANEEQWASEASAHLRAIKNAWRNYAQHGRARYNEEEAVSIWNNVQSLMQTLAKKLG